MQVQNGGKREAGKANLHAMVPIHPTMLLEAENEDMPYTVYETPLMRGSDPYHKSQTKTNEAED